MRELKGGVYFPGGLPLAERVHNRFGGMRDLAVLRGVLEMRAKKRSGKRKFDYERERDFLFLLGWDAGIVREK